MEYIVTFKNLIGQKVPLRGTIIAMHMDRAQRFPTREAALAQLEKAKQFMKAKTFKSAIIEEIEIGKEL